MHQFPGAWSCLAQWRCFLTIFSAILQQVNEWACSHLARPLENLCRESEKQSRADMSDVVRNLLAYWPSWEDTSCFSIWVMSLSAFQALALIPCLDLRFSDLIVLLCPIEGCVLSSSCIWYKADRYWWKSVGIFLFSLALFSDLSSPNLPNLFTCLCLSLASSSTPADSFCRTSFLMVYFWPG